MAKPDLRKTLSYLYALLTGIVGLLVLTWLFARQTTAIDPIALLAFALTALIVSYLRTSIDATGMEVALDGAVLLGAALVGGPALGGWVAFLIGLVTGVIPPYARTPEPERWADKAATAMLTAGRNVVAIVAALWAYRGLGPTTVPTTIDVTHSLAVLVLCLTYALVRYLWSWPMLALQRSASGQDLSGMLSPAQFLLELIPLPAALLIAAVFVQLGWTFFLLLVLLFIWLGALMRQACESIRAKQAQLDDLRAADRIRKDIAATPAHTGALSTLAYELCTRAVPVPKFELGLYDSTYTSVHIQVSVDADEKLPSMRIPLTPQWEWIGEMSAPQVIQGRAQIAQLPFSVPPIDHGQLPQAALYVPLFGDEFDPSEQIGGIVMLAPSPHAFSEREQVRIAEIARQIGPALARASDMARHAQNDALDRHP
jgi:hypothetical protein